MKRNKLIYALADAGLVVDAAYNKGGTWAGAVEQLDKFRWVPMYVRTDNKPSKGLEALQSRGARSWPNPQTPDDLKLALSVDQLYSEAQAQWRRAFESDTAHTAESLSKELTKNAVASTPQTEREEEDTSPAEALLKRVEELLASIETPTTDSAVAAYLQVSQSQAREWLKRLVLEGKYNRSNRPVRYDRIQ